MSTKPRTSALCCDVQTLCIDEAPCSIMAWLTIGAYVEKSYEKLVGFLESEFTMSFAEDKSTKSVPVIRRSR